MHWFINVYLSIFTVSLVYVQRWYVDVYLSLTFVKIMLVSEMIESLLYFLHDGNVAELGKFYFAAYEIERNTEGKNHYRNKCGMNPVSATV